MNPLIRYDAMLGAIAECYRVDEVKDIRDKAMALQAYARQAQNTDAERQACEIRLRAERRTGELLEDLPKDVGGRPSETAATVAGVSPYREALQRTHIPERTAQRYQELARVPQDVFDAQMRDLVMPTTSGIIAAAREAAQIFPFDPRSLCRLEWVGMPEFTMRDLTPLRSVLVHFKSLEDIALFEQLVGQSLGKRLRSIWFPEAEIMRMADKCYVSEGVESRERTAA